MLFIFSHRFYVHERACSEYSRKLISIIWLLDAINTLGYVLIAFRFWEGSLGAGASQKAVVQ